VLLEAVVASLAPRHDATYVDGTFGGGGYSAALLAAARCRVLGIDRDPEAIRRGAALAARHPGRLTLVEGRFGEMERLVRGASHEPSLRRAVVPRSAAPASWRRSCARRSHGASPASMRQPEPFRPCASRSMTSLANWTAALLRPSGC